MIAAVASGGCADDRAAEPAEPADVAGDDVVDIVDVVDVVDGDTFTVRLAGRGAVERVRIIGMNAPEQSECFADQAGAALARLLGAGEIRLVRDASDRDRNGRLLRYVEAAGVDVGEQLVRDGFATVRVSEPDVAREPGLDAAQAEARRNSAGLWAPDACGPEVVGGGGDVEIVGLRVNADGPDAENLNDEWVELANPGDVAVDLSGWGLRDESASHRFAFPDGFALGPGAAVRVRSGCGADTTTELFWCVSGSAVWNNDGDTAFLLDPSGNVVATRSFPR